MDRLSLLENILASAADNVCVVDRDGRIVFVSEQVARFFGAPRDALVGRALGEVLSPTEAAAYQADARAALATGEPVRADSLLRGPEGLRHFEYTASPVRLPGTPELELVVFAGRDVTERRASEQHNRQLQLLVLALAASLEPEAAAEAVIGQIHDYLGAAASVAYFRREDGTLRLAASRNVKPDVTSRLAAIAPDARLPVAFAAATGQAVFCEDAQALRKAFPDLPATGSAVGVAEAIAAVPLVFEGRSFGTIAFGFSEPHPFDPRLRAFLQAVAAQCAQALERARLHERERAARVAAERVAEQRAFLALAGDVLSSSLDADRVLTALAELAVPRIGDWCAIEIQEEGALRVVAAVHRDPEKISMAYELRRRFPSPPDAPRGAPAVMRTGRAEIYPRIDDGMLEAAARSADHLALLRALGMHSALFVPLVASGRPLGVITLVWAESGHVYDQGDLEFASALAHRAAMAVENARLYREAQSAVRAREDFLALAGHELRTPLTALALQVQSAARSAKEDPRLAPFAERLGRAAGNALRLGALIDQLLDVARITSGRLELSPSKIDLADLVRDVSERFAEAAALQGSKLLVHANGPVEGLWDRTRLEQVVTNLVSNAIKYGGGRPIEVALTAAGREAILHVRDEGIGIRGADHARIFDRFERAAGARDYGGLGLGLWISRQIIEACGGRIAVQSDEGSGATFTVQLPRGLPP